MRKRVVVTGVGVVAPNGVGLPAFRAALKAGKSGIRWHEPLKKLNFSCQIGGIPDLREEDILKVIPEAERAKLGEAQVYAAFAAVECARSAGIPVDLSNGFKDGSVDWQTGVVMGCGIGGMDTIFEEMGPAMAEAEAAEPGRGPAAMGTGVVPKIMGSSTSVVIGRFLGLGNLTSSNSSACNTGTEAVFAGYNHIQLGLADAMYVGGAEGAHYAIWAGFDAMRDVLCSKYNEMPEKGSQPMGAGACGFVPGSGAGVLRLETLESARKRGAPILAELLAASCNSGGQRDGGSMTFPNPEGVARCIRKAVRDAGVSPSSISLVNGHLTSTGADPQEVGSWMAALELEPERFPLIQSTKSMIGHGLGAAGAMEAVASVDQLKEGYVHPSINCDEVHPLIRAIASSIPRSCVEQSLELVIKASFGFGDVNGCLMFKRWDGR
ncbi:MAG: beta-ketoacyl-[acyl-carrier-protein] synthase family protein [Elusimicrobia bacterium]|nr:beta-ketoacyl-[acyl-carrier-protein] synthase family protein [Elusimicrobiota bacterium]